VLGRVAAAEGGVVIAALFVATGGCYFGLPDVDPWDEKRDARLYAGPYPVVAHPPCSAWGRLAPVNQARWGRPVGEDGGCFASALASVRQWGGVLEHPAGSYAWPYFGLDSPTRGHWLRTLYSNAWVTAVSQRAYGHPATKATWLYFVGDAPPSLDWTSPAPIAAVSYLRNRRSPDLPRLTKKQAQATPIPFRDLLLGMARSVGERRRVA
jgi:hypothetical protein